jgi:ATP-dependent exoDNAse (exonuclease V) beta subunit
MYDYPRVTEIIKATNDPETEAKLLRWRKAMEKKGLLNDDATNFGTQVHSEIERYLKEGIIGNTTHFKLVYNWLYIQQEGRKKGNGFKAIACERVIQSEVYKYRGRLDLLFMRNGKTYILDWTTSARHKRRQFIEHKFIQGAAYAIAIEEETGYKVTNLMVVVLSSKMQVFEANTEDYKEIWLKRVKQYYEQLNTMQVDIVA